jgi:hypothetical protein
LSSFDVDDADEHELDDEDDDDEEEEDDEEEDGVGSENGKFLPINVKLELGGLLLFVVLVNDCDGVEDEEEDEEEEDDDVG